MDSIQVEMVRRIFRSATQDGGFDSVLKDLEIISAKDGKLKAELKISKEHCNIYGTLHGGFIATLIDMTTSVAMAVTPQRGSGVSVDLTVSYLKKATIGEEIIIDATTTKIGRTLGFAEAVITNKKGEVIAKGLHTKFVGDHEKHKMPEKYLECSLEDS